MGCGFDRFVVSSDIEEVAYKVEQFVCGFRYPSMYALPCGIGRAGEFVNTVGNNGCNEVGFGKKVPVQGS